MSYPRLIIDLDKIHKNAVKIHSMCSRHGVEVVGVTKVVCGDPTVARTLLDSGIEILGDSRLKNIERMKANGINSKFMLLRIPMLSELRKAVELVDVFLVSELEVVKVLSDLSKKVGMRRQIIYMVDLGDLREGVWFENSIDEIVSASRFSGVELVGIGTNLGCYGGIIPTPEKMKQLVEIARVLRSKNVNVKIVSAGNTAALPLIEMDELPNEVNQYRIGEAIMLGTDATNNRTIEYLERETFILEVEIVEIKIKPSIPVGKIGKDSFGRTPRFEDRGNIKRAILAIGEQDVDSKGIFPMDKRAKVLHASSDHMIVDISESDVDYRIGDKMCFLLNYSSLLRSMTSQYVEKIFSKRG